MESIYVLTDGSHYKIGVAKDVNARIKQLQIGNPRRLYIVFKSSELSNAYELERTIHNEYKPLRTNSEWFDFVDIDKVISYISNLVKVEGTNKVKISTCARCDFFDSQINKLKEEETRLKLLVKKEKNDNRDIEDFLEYLISGMSKGVYSELIYKLLFNKSFAELKEQYGIKSKESLRDYLASEELKELENMEMLISSLIGLGWGYEQIKNFVMQEHTKKLAS